MICKVCKEDKVKDPVIRGNVTRFVDQSGQMWNGKMCPQCYRAYNKERMRKARSLKIQSSEIKL